MKDNLEFTYEMFKYMTTEMSPLNSILQKQLNLIPSMNIWLLFYKTKENNEFLTISLSQNNKIVIPGKEMQNIKPGTLCYLPIEEFGRDYYKTLGTDNRELQYWKYIFSLQKDKAIDFLKLKLKINLDIASMIVNVDYSIWSILLKKYDKTNQIANKIFQFYTKSEIK